MLAALFEQMLVESVMKQRGTELRVPYASILRRVYEASAKGGSHDYPAIGALVQASSSHPT
jgi:hypothetical protein